MKIIRGSEIAGFIKERQAAAVRSLTQGFSVTPKLAIIRTNPDPAVDLYMRLKKNYGAAIGALVEVFEISCAGAVAKIQELNADETVHGIIVQLPVADVDKTQEIVDAVAPEKDVDGLGASAKFDPATPTAINWLLAGNNINLAGRQIVIVGNGRLVGAPLAKIWQSSGYHVAVADSKTTDLAGLVRTAEVLVTGAGSPGLIKPDMIMDGAVVVDAGVASDTNGLVGDLDPDVRNRDDLTITPEKGGVGPLTVSVLFENVITAARNAAK